MACWDSGFITFVPGKTQIIEVIKSPVYLVIRVIF
jgi:hypothetical protein